MATRALRSLGHLKVELELPSIKRRTFVNIKRIGTTITKTITNQPLVNNKTTIVVAKPKPKKQKPWWDTPVFCKHRKRRPTNLEKTQVKRKANIEDTSSQKRLKLNSGNKTTLKFKLATAVESSAPLLDIAKKDIYEVDLAKIPREFNVKTLGWVSESRLSLDSVNNFFCKNTAASDNETYLESTNPAVKQSTNYMVTETILRLSNVLGAKGATSPSVDIATTKDEKQALYKLPVLILDTPAFNTAKMLLTSAIKAQKDLASSDIHIPNFNFDLSAIKKSFGNGATSAGSASLKNLVLNNCSVGMYLEKLDRIVQFKTIWLDYCCTWRGNDLCRPFNDVELIFSQHRVASGGMLIVTLCSRSAVPLNTKWSAGKKESEKFYNENNTIREIQDIALKHNYFAKFENRTSYLSMYFLAFEIIKV